MNLVSALTCCIARGDEAGAKAGQFLLNLVNNKEARLLDGFLHVRS